MNDSWKTKKYFNETVTVSSFKGNVDLWQIIYCNLIPGHILTEFFVKVPELLKCI